MYVTTQKQLNMKTKRRKKKDRTKGDDGKFANESNIQEVIKKIFFSFDCGTSIFKFIYETRRQTSGGGRNLVTGFERIETECKRYA